MIGFVVTDQDVLVISITVHLCVLIELLANRMFGWLAPVLSERSSLLRTLVSLNRATPCLLGKVFMEQATLYGIILLMMLSLAYTSLSVTPFSHQPQPYPKFLIRVILSATTARSSVMAIRILLVRNPEICQNNTKSPGPCSNSKVDFSYFAYIAVNNLICLGYHENLLLVVTSSFMEVSSTPATCCRLIELSNNAAGSQSYRKTTILTCALCIVCRIILPLLFLMLAWGQESPFCMTQVSLANFFIGGVFYVIFNSLFLYESVRCMKSSLQQGHLQSLDNSTASPVPFSIHMSPHENEHSDVNESSDHCQMNDFSYSLIHSYSNKHLCCNFDSDDGGQSYVTEQDNVQQMPIKKMARNSNRDILSRFRFNSYSGGPMSKSRSYDYLLGSQDLVNDRHVKVLWGELDNDISKYEKDTSSQEVRGEKKLLSSLCMGPPTDVVKDTCLVPDEHKSSCHEHENVRDNILVSKQHRYSNYHIEDVHDTGISLELHTSSNDRIQHIHDTGALSRQHVHYDSYTAIGKATRDKQPNGIL